MNESMAILFALGLVGAIVIGAICGIVAVASLVRIRKRLEDLESELFGLKSDVRCRVGAPRPQAQPEQPRAPFPKPFAWPEAPPAAAASPREKEAVTGTEAFAEQVPEKAEAVVEEAAATAREAVAPKPPLPEGAPEPPAAAPEAAAAPEPQAAAPEPQAAAPEPSFAAPPLEEKPPAPSFSLEQTLGTKWLVWAGVVLLLIGGGYFLKYAYDNSWIGPAGRLAIGAFWCFAALGAGEWSRRKNWQVLFQSLTGGGLAGFYVCIFFSFQVYHLAGQETAMGLAVLVTALAVALAVAHNAVAIAILALIGGFLSPVLLSTGANHPHALFIYVAILDLVAMGAAYYRHWRALDTLAFVGTAILYQGWRMKFYGAPGQPDQLPPALIYATLFYLMFLLIPMLNSLARRLPEQPEGLTLLALNTLFSFYSYYCVLFAPYRMALGFVILGQALMVFLLFKVWLARQPSDRRTAESLLTIGLMLVTIAIPIQLRFYAIPVAWAAEAVVVAYLGVRFGRMLLRFGGVVALLLAAAKLLDLLPMHRVVFTPVFNAPFGSWAFAVAAAAAAWWLLYRDHVEPANKYLAAVAVLLGFALGCVALSLETVDFWRINQSFVPHHDTHGFSSLVVLWALIGAGVTGVLLRARLLDWAPLSLVCYAVGAILFVAGFWEYNLPAKWFALNAVFFPRLFLLVSLWWAGEALRRRGKENSGLTCAVAGHVLLTALLAVEMKRWGSHCDWMSSRLADSLISALWGLQAFALIAIGLRRRDRVTRILGFMLFALTVSKVLGYDMQELEKVYRIVSFIGTGFFLVLAGYLYQRYSAVLLKEEAAQKTEGGS